ncbi:hypothetical protein POTOM_044897 [Populus tomentosa]|uniref:Uncharacterized protein n=1 Tax=Populus tomentosa TaxID=118781 RepID=A0A8X7YHW1_POPTO|nr:hypothetical protein POTOM_044897 [Populus tomentosa]
MVLKRPFQFDGGEDGFGMGGPGAQESKRFRNAVRDVMGRLSVNDFMSKMEPLLRAVVRDEVERTVLRVLQSSSSSNPACIDLAKPIHYFYKLWYPHVYKKHHPPHLHDEIWRLERIAKDGAFHKRLASEGVGSVQEFLQLYMTDPTMLRTVLGCGISNRIWDTIIEHATTCVLDESKFYSYFDAGQSIGLLFDSIYKVVGVTFDGQNYESLHNLSPPQKALVENIKRQAYKNLNNFIQVDASANFGPSRSLTPLQAEPFNGPDLALQQLEFPVIRQEMQMDFNNSSSSTSYGYDTESSSPLEVSGAQTTHQEAFPQMFRNSFKFTDFLPLPYTEENSWSPKGWPVVTTEELSPEDISGVQTPTWSPGNSTWGTGGAFIFTAGDEGDAGFFSSLPSFGIHMSRIRPPKARWCKLRAALKMGSFMRDLAARRMLTRPLYVNY